MIRNEQLRERVEAKIQEIAAALTTTVPQGQPLSVMAGPAGSILYYFYTARMQDSGALYDRAFELLQHSLDALEETSITSLTYCNGLVGFGLLFQLLVDQGLLDAAVDDILSALDELIIEHTLFQLQEDNLDFLHGATGNGFYLLRRRSTPAARQCLARLVAHLAATAVHDAQGVHWCDVPSTLNDFASNTVNLSLSHGLSSKLLLLAHCVRADVEAAVCGSLLAGGIHYLQQQAVPARAGNTYASFVAPDGTPRYSERLAWCYGDLGVVTALVVAGKATNNAAWVEQGVHLALRAAQRISPTQTALVDAGFCHGTAGVAHIFNRLYWESHRDEFRSARDYWVEQTLAHATFPSGLAGYKAYQDKTWLPDDSLLEGIMGIGLVLQSCLATEETDLSWDSLFLLDFSEFNG